MLRARWSVYACECVRALWCMWHGKGYISQRAPGPDVWLPLTGHSRRGWSAAGPTTSPPFPRTKAMAQLKDVNSVAFVLKAQRHAEWEIWPLPKVRLCFWTPLALSGSMGQEMSERMGWCGCELFMEWGAILTSRTSRWCVRVKHEVKQATQTTSEDLTLSAAN